MVPIFLFHLYVPEVVQSQALSKSQLGMLDTGGPGGGAGAAGLGPQEPGEFFRASHVGPAVLLVFLSMHKLQYGQQKRPSAQSELPVQEPMQHSPTLPPVDGAGAGGAGVALLPAALRASHVGPCVLYVFLSMHNDQLGQQNNPSAQSALFLHDSLQSAPPLPPPVLPPLPVPAQASQFLPTVLFVSEPMHLFLYGQQNKPLAHSLLALHVSMQHLLPPEEGGGAGDGPGPPLPLQLYMSLSCWMSASVKPA